MEETGSQPIESLPNPQAELKEATSTAASGTEGTTVGTPTEDGKAPAALTENDDAENSKRPREGGVEASSRDNNKSHPAHDEPASKRPRADHVGADGPNEPPDAGEPSPSLPESSASADENGAMGGPTEGSAGVTTTSTPPPNATSEGVLESMTTLSAIVCDDENAATEPTGDGDSGAMQASVFSPVVTRSRKKERVAPTDEATSTTSTDEQAGADGPPANSSAAAEDDPLPPPSDVGTTVKTSRTLPERWRVHEMAEDYMHLVGNMMYPGTKFRPYGYNPEKHQYPIEGISVLGFIKSKLRRPTIIEKWSPYEIAVFEGSLLHFGKEFRKVSRQIETKSTQEVIDFYYIWKKTAHYKRWKEQYIPDADLMMELQSPVKKPKR